MRCILLQDVVQRYSLVLQKENEEMRDVASSWLLHITWFALWPQAPPQHLQTHPDTHLYVCVCHKAEG